MAFGHRPFPVIQKLLQMQIDWPRDRRKASVAFSHHSHRLSQLEAKTEPLPRKKKSFLYELSPHTAGEGRGLVFL